MPEYSAAAYRKQTIMDHFAPAILCILAPMVRQQLTFCFWRDASEWHSTMPKTKGWVQLPPAMVCALAEVAADV